MRYGTGDAWALSIFKTCFRSYCKRPRFNPTSYLRQRQLLNLSNIHLVKSSLNPNRFHSVDVQLSYKEFEITQQPDDEKRYPFLFIETPSMREHDCPLSSGGNTHVVQCHGGQRNLMENCSRETFEQHISTNWPHARHVSETRFVFGVTHMLVKILKDHRA